MYLTVREYREVRSLEEIGRRVQDGLVPMLRRMTGFRAYFAVGTASGGGAFSISVFEEREAALHANEQTRAWVVARLRDLVPSPPEVMGGTVLHHATAPQERQGDCGHVILHCFDSVAPLTLVWPKLWEAVSPRLTQQSGFQHLYALTSEAHSRRGIAVAMFEGQETPTVQQHLVTAMAAQMPDLIPSPPLVTCGRVLAVAGV